MSLTMKSVSESCEAIVSALVKFCKRDGQEAAVKLIESARPECSQIENPYDNEDGYILNLLVPTEVYLEHQQSLDGIQNVLGEYAREVVKGMTDEYIANVQFVIDLELESHIQGAERQVAPTSADIARIWTDPHFRLFVSHSSHDKLWATTIAERLLARRVHCFVAHQDINPSLEWSNEIKLALSSCRAVLYLSSQSSNMSAWCQQEVGWGLGRGLLVLSVRLDSDPAAFASLTQAVSLPTSEGGVEFATLRERIIRTLIVDERTNSFMHDPLVTSLGIVKKPRGIEIITDDLNAASGLSRDSLTRIAASLDNPVIAEDDSLRAGIEKILKRNDFDIASSAADSDAADADKEFDPFAEDEFDPFAS